MESSCREEGELSDDENDDIVMINSTSSQLLNPKPKDEVIVIEDDDDDKQPRLPPRSAVTRVTPLTTLNSHTDNINESRMGKMDKIASSRKKHKIEVDTKHHRTKHRLDEEIHMARAFHSKRNSHYTGKKKAREDALKYSQNNNSSSQSGFMDKMRCKFQGSGKLSDLLKNRPNLQKKDPVSVMSKCALDSQEPAKELKTQKMNNIGITGVPNISSNENVSALSEHKTKEVHSPVVDDDQEYAHLLLEYKEIKEKLVELQQEEKSLFDIKTDVSPKEVPDTQTVIVSALEDKTEVVDMELASSEDDTGQIKIMQKEPVEEEDDIDLLELRLAALESAARAKKSDFAKEKTAVSDSKEKSAVKKNSMKAGPAGKGRSRQRSASLTRAQQAEEERLYREKERIWREKRRIRKIEADLMYERDMIERWHEKHLKEDVWMGEIQRVLSTDDPHIRRQRALQLFGLKESVGQGTTASFSHGHSVYHSGKISSPSQGNSEQFHKDKHQEDLVTPLQEIQCQQPQNTPQRGDHQSAPKQPAKIKDTPEANAAAETTTPAPSRGSVEEDDEEEDILRAKLLASVARRRREREQQVLEERGGASGSDGQLQDSPSAQELKSFSFDNKAEAAETSSDNRKRSRQSAHSVMAIPQHRPVIIALGGDSSDESEEEPTAKQARFGGETRTGSFIGSLDSFLKAARKSVEEPVFGGGKTDTPEALRHLGSHKVQEYRRLKEEIRKREGGHHRRRKQANKAALLVTVSDDSKPEGGMQNSNERVVSVQGQVEREVTLQGLAEREVTLQGLAEREVTLQGPAEREVTLHGMTDRKITVQGQVEREVTLKHTDDRELTQQGVRELEETGVVLEVGEDNLADRVVLLPKSRNDNASTDTQVTLQARVESEIVADQAVMLQTEELDSYSTDSEAVQPTSTDVKEEQQPVILDQRIVLPEITQSDKDISSQDEGVCEAVEMSKMSSPHPDVKAMSPKQLKQLKLKTALQRRLIDQEKQQIQQVRHLINKKKSVVKLAEQKIHKMKEQMTATHTVLKANLQQISMLNKNAQSLQAKMDVRREKLVLLEKEVKEVEARPIRTHIEEIGGMLQSMKDVSRTGEQVDEKSRLMQLEQQYAALIRSYRESQATGPPEEAEAAGTQRDSSAHSKRRTSWGFGCRWGSMAKPKELEHVLTEERMPVSAGEEPQEDQISKLKKRRRSSLYSGAERSLTKPHLEVEAGLNGRGSEVTKAEGRKSQGSEVTQAGGSRETSPVGESSLQSFSTPTGQHLLNLKRLHMESLSNPSIFNTTSDTAVNSKTVISDLKYCPRISSGAEHSNNAGTYREYQSPLLKFKSYRLSPYFRTKSGLRLTSSTFNSQIVPSKILCRYDLTGKCNDDCCPWQHESDYRLEGVEVLQDLLAYSPQLAGVLEGALPESYSTNIERYAEQFGKQNQKMTLDQQCILLSSEVNRKANKVVPHTMHLEARRWKPKASLTRPHQESDGPDKEVVKVEFTPPNPQTKVRVPPDDVLYEEDLRYWMLSAEEVQDMESSIIENPHQTQVWSRLAHKKLHSGTGGESGVNEALNVLSRGLEANRESKDLWLHYLAVYRQRHDLSDLYSLHRQAIHFSPCYQLYWQFLKLQPSFSKKMQLCSEIEESLSKEGKSEVNSHRVLEVILYKVQLMVLTGRLKSAKHMFKTSLDSARAPSLLSVRDLVLAWLSYIHLHHLHTLPQSLFSPADSNPGKITDKTPFEIEWSASKSGKAPRYAALCSLLHEAISACSQTAADVTNGVGESSDTPAVLPLYQNTVNLHLTLDRTCEAQKVCNLVLQEYSSAAEVWLFCHQTELKLGNLPQAIQLLERSLVVLPTSPCLQHALASTHLSRQQDDCALEVLELCPFSFFCLPEQEESELRDPNLLYSILLKLPTPLKCDLPAKKPGVTEDMIKACLPYLWLNYCRLLELQGCNETEVTEVYETALSSLHSTKHLKLFWKCYLDHALQRLQTVSPASRPAVFVRVCELVWRCLASVPLRVPLPCEPDCCHTDYSFHVGMVEQLAACLSPSQRGKAYEDALNRMPHSVHLLTRACQHFCREGEVSRALGTCAVLFDDLSSSLPVCKMYLSLMYQTGNMKEVQRLYSLATKKLPYCIWLWKNYLLFEATWGKPERVKQIVQQCRDLEVNIDEFRSTVLRC